MTIFLLTFKTILTHPLQYSNVPLGVCAPPFENYRTNELTLITFWSSLGLRQRQQLWASIQNWKFGSLSDNIWELSQKYFEVYN